MPVCRAFLAVVACFGLLVAPLLAQSDAGLEAAQRAYDKGEYTRAIELLQAAAEKNPRNGDVQLLLAKSHLEAKHYDSAVSAAEKAVASNPKSSVYHQWLGEAYGAKADHASMFSAYPLARKTQKEFETAVQLDEHNLNAAQDLVEYDCTAPSIVGGGEDKAAPLIQKLMNLNAAEGHYATGICRAQKKDYAAADTAFNKALELKLKSVDRLFDAGDYFLQRGQSEPLHVVAEQAQVLAPDDPRVGFYRAVGWILKSEKLPDAEDLLRHYLGNAPPRSTYPKPWEAHYWLGRLQQVRKNADAARAEYQTALKLNPKYKNAQEALKQMGSR